MKYLTLVSIFLFFISDTNAQVEKIQIKNGDYVRLLSSRATDASTATSATYESNPQAAKVVDGSQFLAEEFQPARILMLDDKILIAKCRYDIYNDEIQIETKPGVFRALSNEKFKAVSINNDVFVYRKFINSKKEVTLGYFQVLAAGKASLYTRHYIDVRQSNDNNHPLLGNKLNNKDIKLHRKKKFFYSFDDEKIFSLNPKKRVILQILKDNKKEVEALISDLKLRVKKEEDLKKIFDYYNKSKT